MAKIKHSPFGIISLVTSLLALIPFPLVFLLYSCYDLELNKNEFIWKVLSSFFIQYSHIIVICSIVFVIVTLIFSVIASEKSNRSSLPIVSLVISFISMPILLFSLITIYMMHNG